MDLRARWKQLWTEVAAANSSSVDLAFARILTKYNEPHRAYHTLKHIEDCLTLFDKFKHLAADTQVVEAAIWWQDLIYDTKDTQTNESRSASVAEVDMNLIGCSSAFQRHVVDSILATKHDHEVATDNQRLLLDIDLHTLGVSTQKYKQYVTAIRKEYDWVPWDEYAQGRVKVLQGFLSRENIFQHPALRKKYEGQARFNIRREIRFLQREKAP
ncbi:MAG: hypothetical protein K9M10_01690 [Candidatus Pacebacteria bacterium]|nr:hypothetical protein [Candidatus Paceibacterota bacterium]MCF7857175.1 hypothetical protein [Candidatus Paceibacterota bacterium]